MEKGKVGNKEWCQAELTDDEEGDVTDVSGSNVATIGSSQDIVTDPSTPLRASESSLYSIDSVSDTSAARIPATSTSNLELDDVFTSNPGPDASSTVVTPSACVSSISKDSVVSQSSAETFIAAESSEISTSAQIASSMVDTPSSSDSLITESSDISTSALCASSTVGIPSSNTLANIDSIEVCSSSAPNASSTTGMPPDSIPATIDPSHVSTSASNYSSVTEVSSAYTSAAEEPSKASTSASSNLLTSDTTTENTSTINENLNATTSTLSNLKTAETASTCISPSTEGTDESLSSPSLTSSNMEGSDDETNLSMQNKNPNIDMPILRSMLSQPSSDLPEKPWSFYEAQGYRMVSDDGSVRSRSPLSETGSGERCAIQLPTTDVDKNPKEHQVENPSEVNEINVRRMFDNMELLQTEQTTQQATDAKGNVEIIASDVPTTSDASNTLDINAEISKKVSDGAATTPAVDNAACARASSAVDATADISTSAISENINDTITVAITDVVNTNTDSSCNITDAGSEGAAPTQFTLSCTITNLTVIDPASIKEDMRLIGESSNEPNLALDPASIEEDMRLIGESSNEPNLALDPASIEEDMRLIGESSNEPTTEGNTTLPSPIITSLTHLDSQMPRTRSSERIVVSDSPLRKRRFSLPGRSSEDEVNLGATTSTSQKLEGDDDDNHHGAKRHRQHSLEGVQSVNPTEVIQTQASEEKMDESKQAGDDVEKEETDKDH